MVCLDTTFLADLLRDRSEARRKLDELDRVGEAYATTVISIGELVRGAWAHSQPTRQIARVGRLVQEIVVWDVNLAAAYHYGQLKAELQSRGQPVGDRDLLIAATALAYGESRIVTRNAKDFERIPGIEVVTY